MSFSDNAKMYNDPEEMGKAYIAFYFQHNEIEYPINPFKMLKDEGIVFELQKYKKLEGVYIPANNEDDIPVVGINIERPITRQRYTAAHELCHHFRDADKQVSCQIGDKSTMEVFAEKFAAAVLMPMNEVLKQIEKYQNEHGKISFDDILEIAQYFGVSFAACLNRIAYNTNAIYGDTSSMALKKRREKYQPNKRRKERHMTYANLYAGLIDCYEEQLDFVPTAYARYVFQNNYIYNDSRMEGLDVSIEEAADIITDLRLNMQNSPYCEECNEAYLSIAGHYEMYQDIFAIPIKDNVSVYDAFKLNHKLFSHYPNKDYGGQTRMMNTCVLGGKFETVDYQEIHPELAKVEIDIKEYFANKSKMSMSNYIKHVVRTHHRLTQIHPFPEGNGRTTRAFMNMQLVRASILPIYIKVEDKETYIRALERADSCGDYDELYELVFTLVLRSYVDLNIL